MNFDKRILELERRVAELADPEREFHSLVNAPRGSYDHGKTLLENLRSVPLPYGAVPEDPGAPARPTPLPEGPLLQELN